MHTHPVLPASALPSIFGAVSAILLALAGCGASAPAGTLPIPPAAAGHCPGSVHGVAGLREADDPTLLSKAMGEPGHGGLCNGRVFEALLPVVVYRVWSKAPPSTPELGRWWSFRTPVGPVESYRARYAICSEWSSLDTWTECKLKIGAYVVVGPGQSAHCNAVDYAASAENQVFIPNDTRDPTKPTTFVEACTPGQAWPATDDRSP
jgi:hypothetical protein